MHSECGVGAERMLTVGDGSKRSRESGWMQFDGFWVRGLLIRFSILAEHPGQWGAGVRRTGRSVNFQL